MENGEKVVTGESTSKGLWLPAALVISKLAASSGEARRHIEAGAVRVNDVPVTAYEHCLTSADVLAEGVIKLSVGKKRHALIKPV